MTGRCRSRRRATTLIEAVVVVVVLALAVPPILTVTNDVAASRADAVHATCAAALAQGTLEQVLADVHTGSSLAAPDYLDAPETGLIDRLAWLASPYVERGFDVNVEIGELVARSGEPTGDAAQDIFRIVTAAVTFPTSRGSSELRISMMVGEP